MRISTNILLAFIAVMLIQTSVKGNTAEPTKEDVLQFFARFEDAYAKKDKSELKKILDTSQLEWCFDELDRGANPVKFEVDKDTIKITPPRATTSTMVYRQMNGGGSSAKTHLICFFEKREGTLLLVDMKAPGVEASNFLMDKASELANQMTEAVKNNNQHEFSNLLGEGFQQDGCWVKDLLAKDTARIDSFQIERKRDGICITFTAKNSSNEVSKHVMYLDKQNDENGTKYYLTDNKPTKVFLRKQSNSAGKLYSNQKLQPTPVDAGKTSQTNKAESAEL